MNDAFPLYIPGWEGKIDGSAKTEMAIAANVAGEYSTKIEGLLFSLDELNHSLMMNFRAVYLAFAANPCGGSQMLVRQVEALCVQQNHLQMIRIKVRGLVALAESHPGEHQRFLKAFHAITQEMTGPSVQAEALAEIRSLGDNMRKLIEASNG